jgi:GT2 family glycosyltransferase
MCRSASEVSIITVNWNGEAHLRNLLPTLVPLDAGEIIVVDNGSSDASVAFLQAEYPQVRIIRNEINRGFCQPNNRAAEEAKGKYLAFINNDMRAHPDWLRSALDQFGGNVCVGSRILDWKGERIDFNGSSLQYLGYALQRDSGELADAVRNEDKILFPCGGAMLIERDVFLKEGGFDEDFFAVYEDVDLGWRLWVLGYEIGFAPDSIVYHRGHGTFQAHREEKLRFLMHRNAQLTILKNYEDEQVQKILPLAVVMAIKRAIRCSGVRKESFHLWSDVRLKLRQGDDFACSEIVDALNHLVATEDMFRLLPAISEKRRSIQKRRKRSDAQITQLFQDPLRPIVQDFEYEEQELEYLQFLGLDSLFEVKQHQERLNEMASPLPYQIQDLRKELNAIQWVGLEALMHPPKPPLRLTKFIRVWRECGFRAATHLLRNAAKRAF